MNTKIFFSSLAALLVAMAVGFGFWKHEQWVSARNQCIAVMQEPTQIALHSSGEPEAKLAAIHAAQQSSATAARRLIAIFDAKILPLSHSDRYWLKEARNEVEEDEFNSAFNNFIDEITYSKSKKDLEGRSERFISEWEKKGRLTQERRKRVEDAVRTFSQSIDMAEAMRMRNEAASKEAEAIKSRALKEADEVLSRSRGTLRTQETGASSSASARGEITLIKEVTVQLATGGTLTLYPGTIVKFVSRDGDNVRFHYSGTDYDVPVSATDLQ
jgi:hypothetical protein